MRTPIAVLIFTALLASCGSESKQPAAEAPKKAEAPKPADESQRFPKANRTGTQVVDNNLLGKPFMPGGTLAHYKKGQTEYQMFVARMPSAQDAAFLLLDWRKALKETKLIPSWGGYFGQDSGTPVFVFAKGSWIAGVVGLSEKDADTVSRVLAAELD